MKKKHQIKHSLGFIAIFGAFLMYATPIFATPENHIRILDYSFDENARIYIKWQIWNAPYNTSTPDVSYVWKYAGFGYSFNSDYNYALTGFTADCKADTSYNVCIQYPETLIFGASTLAHREGGLLISDISDWLGDTDFGITTLTQGASHIFYQPPYGSCDGACGDTTTFSYGEPVKIAIGSTGTPYITISTPTSGSTITASADTFILTGNYYNISTPDYQGFLINFRDQKLNTASESIDFKLASSDTGTGTFKIPLSKFGITQNGHWDLHALAYGMALDIQSGLFLTTRGYVDFFSEELVIPPYYLLFNVAGFSEPFTFDNWNDWYAINVSDYGTPEPVVSTLAGYIQPFFERIGGFASRISLYWNLNEAFDRGFGLGQIFPTIEAYIKKIEMFFGGFPLFTFLKYILLILMAIFIVRTILKFIPFIG